MKFHALDLKVERPQKLCHIQFNAHSFPKNSQIVFKTSENYKSVKYFAIPIFSSYVYKQKEKYIHLKLLLNISQMRDDENLDVKKQPVSTFECGNKLQV